LKRPLATRCVETTRGQVDIADGGPIRANYCSTCGGISAAVWEAWPTDPRDYLRSMRDAESRGHEIVGVWHSHTHTDAYPSPTDVRQAVDPAWWYVIVSLKYGEPVLRAYEIRDGAITEVPVEVS